MRVLFHGSELCEVDADGTVAIPGFLGEALADQPAELVIARHEADTCLIGYGPDHLATLAGRNERRRLGDEERGEDARNHYRRMRRSFGLSERVAPSEARLRIPAAMRHLGRIGSLALFVGTGDSFEIWNPELALESEDQQFRDLAAYRLGTRGTKGVH